VVIGQYIHKTLGQRFSNWGGGAPAGGAVGPAGGGGRVVCVGDKFILNEIWAKDKRYNFEGTVCG
jgi:hypothetical protein